ncbi:MAG: hypothetical protein K5Q68_15560 [Roseococcus sp.]|nr:hypothetical protein [Roseococcus sp.]
MKKPWHLPSWRHGALASRGALLASATFLMAPPADIAWAQSCTVSGGACTIASGNYTQPYSYASTLSALTATNNGTFTISTGTNASSLYALEFALLGSSGASTSSGDAGNATNGGTLTLTNNGAISQTIANQLNTPTSAVTLYVESRGGNGGNYTNLNDKGDAGAAGQSNLVTVTNNANLVMTNSQTGGAPSTLVFGGVLLGDSLGGQGGSVASNSLDSDGNPNYENDGRGSNGGYAAAVTVTNSASVTANLSGGPYVSQGFVGVGARSLGGNAGNGSNGPSGGASGHATVTTTGNVSVSLGWGAATGLAATIPVTQGAFAVLAQSQAGFGTLSTDKDKNGGVGGDAGQATVTAGRAGTPVTISLATSNPVNLSTTPLSAAIGAISRGGDGGAGYHQSQAGQGGVTGLASVTTLDSLTVRATGDRTLGILALSQGGNGGDSGLKQSNSTAANGGSAGRPTDTTDYASITMTNTVVSTSGLLSAGVMATTRGGAGGTGLPYEDTGVGSDLNPDAKGGVAGGGGNTGPVSITITGGAITTLGGQSPGVVALAQGGLGGRGGNVNALGGFAGAGGSGGQGAPITVTINSGTVIDTSGAPSASGANPAYGIHAASLGGQGGNGGSLNAELGGAAAAGGYGGGGYDVTVNMNSGSITTRGAGASAIAAFSFGGNGGSSDDYNAGGFAGVPAKGGDSGSSGAVSVTNAGTLTTFGAAAHGISAQSRSGVSGNGSNGAGALYGPSGDAGRTGTTGAVFVTNSGMISTSGASAFGIQAQAVGGGSGSGGSSSGTLVSFGGSATAAANGGLVSVTQSAGAISTRGDYALGILAQSVGGGGGNAGDSSGVFGSIGGDAGGGGIGAPASVDFNGGSVSTLGHLAHGVVVQSIGGGGGNGGDANASGSVFTLSIGGTGGDGGAGGSVSVTATGGSISTSGSNAAGLVAQSIAGGGGTGGSGYSVTAGSAFSAAVSIGGSGGDGGGVSPVTLNLSGLAISTGLATRRNTNQNPVDAYGIVAQSIGGGGGMGGSAAARALAIAIPIPASGGGSAGATISSSVGGPGGASGGGGAVALTLANGSVSTQGQGSHAILLQSIGGGGGAGGDSSAMAATTGYGRGATEEAGSTFTSEISIGLGGQGESGGAGGNITANINASTITTLGDFANGLVAQSVGGGGGNGGLGSSTTQSFGSSTDVTANVGLGGRGEDGGAGGTVSITTDSRAVIQTYGASAAGVVGQSIGGGGGTSQGGTFNLGGPIPLANGTVLSPSGNLTLNLGLAGGDGGNGNTVTANIGGQIRTAGSDSAGVLLQSIGGGGGVGGSAGAEASSDNPVDPQSRLRDIVSNVLQAQIPVSFGATLSLGGRGGTGGDGRAVNYGQSGTIATLGDWSHGVVLQSIGGGGGTGGATASLSSQLALSASLTLGVQNSVSGAGGTIGANFSAGSSISTGLVVSGRAAGYAAFGVLAQSIGGGGGMAADGSTVSSPRITLGGIGTGASDAPAPGPGGAVSVTGSASITTRGDVGIGMVLQSIGGGGGVAGGGNSFSASAGPFSGETRLQVGGTNNMNGNGGTVTLDGTFNIQTSGAHAFGILAQSIAGGGGFAFSTNQASTVTNALGGRIVNANAGVPGSSSVDLTQRGSIRTSGMGAHGIVAQSIGGGGGIAGLPTGTQTAPPSLTTLAYRSLSSGSTASGDAGTVSILTTGSITTQGNFAYGILAQSVGGGGGFYAQGSQVFAGTTNSGTGPVIPSGRGQNVQVTIYQPIRATGTNSVGVFAQSVGVSGAGQVGVSAYASVQGGAGSQGTGIWVDSVNTSSFILVGPDATISASSGQAIRMTAGNVTNQGTIAGSYTLSNGSFSNSGTLNAGASLVAFQLENAGLIRIATHVLHGVSAVSGDFVQRPGGRLLLDADFSNRRSGVLTVEGAADLAGRVRPVISSVVPNVEVPFLVVNGPVTGAVESESSALFSYRVSRKDGTFSISANADFTPAGYTLDRNALGVAGHLQGAWDAGGAGLGPLFAVLGNTAETGGQGAYNAALLQISPNASLAPAARMATGARNFANGALSCPQFEGSTNILREGECIWAGLTGRTAAQSSAEGVSSFRLNSTMWQLGGQRAMGGGWFLGGSFAYENSRLSTTEGLVSGRGEAGYGAVTAKYQAGPWLFSGAVFGGGGEFTSTRVNTLPGFGGVARGSPTLSNVGGLVRGTYTLGQEAFYLRPSVTLGLTHVRSGAYRENGSSALALDVASASGTVAALTPALEIGGRVDFANGVVMRLYTSVGVSLLSDGQWSQQARLVTAPAAAGRFASVVRTDQTVGRVAAGAQVFATDRLELRLQYEGEYSSNLTGHGGSVALAMRF